MLMHLEQVLLVDRVREDFMVQVDLETYLQCHLHKEILVLVQILLQVQLLEEEGVELVQREAQKTVVTVQQIQYLVHQ